MLGMDDNKKDIIISEGNRPVWQVVIAAFLYTITVVTLITSIFDLEFFVGPDFKLHSSNYIRLSIFSFIMAVRFSTVKNILLDIKNKRYKTELAVGIFKMGKWKPLPNVEYISVFKQRTGHDSNGDGTNDTVGEIYDVNVWYNTSKHFTIYSNFEFEPAFEMGKHIAVQLNVDLLDASVPNDSKWVELTN